MAGGNMYEGGYEVTDGKGDTLYLGRMEGGKLGRLYGLPWSAEAVEQLTEELARKNPENTGAIGGEMVAVEGGHASFGPASPLAEGWR